MGIPKRPTAILAADNLTPFVQWDNIQTQRLEAGGIGFGGNRLFTRKIYGQGLARLNIRRDLNGVCFMENAQSRVVSMHNSFDYDPTKYIPTLAWPCQINPPYYGNFWLGHSACGPV